MFDTSEDVELLSAARSGDQDAFETLVWPMRDRLWGVCLRIAGNHADADDAFQDCLLAMWRALPKFRLESRFSTWSYRIATNAALNVVRRRREVPFDTAEREVASTDDPAHNIANRDAIQKALELLGEEFREALVLREFGQLTYDEIAIHQGVNIQTVKSRLHRARAKMRVALGEGEG
jgi:RNA polymerase sigma-70 factor (ECF subfamily)